jgi:hypothetical protein
MGCWAPSGVSWAGATLGSVPVAWAGRPESTPASYRDVENDGASRAAARPAEMIR